MLNRFTSSPRARRGLLRLAIVGLGALPLGLSAVRAEDAPTEVKIDNFAFVPGELKVKVGTTVTWVNHDDIPHTVLGVGTSIRSKTMDTDGSYTFKFERAGTFNYICALHPHMKGKVVVTP